MSLKNLSVLVVDDEEHFRFELREFLEGRVRSVVGAANGKEALYLMERLHFDVVISDLRMPTMDGFELFREMTARRIPAKFIMMTAFPDMAALTGALRMGLFDYLEKPFHLADIKDTLEQVTLKRCHSFTS